MVHPRNAFCIGVGGGRGVDQLDEVLGGESVFRQAAPMFAKCDAAFPVPPILPPIHRFSTTEMDHLVS
jgi:hypothetical protein